MLLDNYGVDVTKQNTIDTLTHKVITTANKT